MRLQIFLYGEDDYKKDWLAVNDYFYNLAKPKDFSQDDDSDGSFVRLCFVLQDNGVNCADELSVFKFFNAVKYMEAKYKTNK